MTFIAQADFAHYFLHTKERGFQEYSGAFHSETSEVLSRTYVSLVLKYVTEPPGRKIYRFRQIGSRQVTVQTMLHQGDDLLHSKVHDGLTQGDFVRVLRGVG
jgi:hypothetical protein